MADKLPAELVINIIQLAAESWRFTDRQSVVNLAITSAASYKLVSPILYHTIILTVINARYFTEFVMDEGNEVLARRVCGHVRALHDFSSELTTKFPAQFFTSLARIHSMGNVIQFIAEENSPCPLRYVSVSSENFGLISSEWLPSHAREVVTHLTGYLPIFFSESHWDNFTTNPKGWIGSIVHPLPALTHLALILVGVPGTNDARGGVHAFRLTALDQALRELLASSRLKGVALHVCGLHVEQRWDEIEALLRSIDDKRLKVWRDDRQLPSWREHRTWAIEDIMNGKDVWSEARPIDHSSAAP